MRMNNKEQEIINEAYRVSIEINEICDKKKKEEVDNENERWILYSKNRIDTKIVLNKHL